MGRPFMPWQEQAADVALEIDPATGRFAYKLVILTVPRQSGKTTVDGAVLEHRAATTKSGRVWFTMQSGKDAVDWFLNEHEPLLSALGPAYRLRKAQGSESIRWKVSGGMVRPFPPTAESLHSKLSDLVVIDECWAFDLVRGNDLDGGIVPTQATRPNAQVWKVSTAGNATSTWWLGTVEAGRAAVAAGRDSGICYLEWSCPDELDPCDPESWPIYHPAYGLTIGAEAMQAALDQMGPDEFARAYGNRWVSTTVRVIPLAAWRACAEEPAELPGPGGLAIGFDVAVDRSDAAIVAGWRDAGGVAHVEVVDHRPGTGWLAERIVEVADRWQVRCIAYDAAGPALDVADVLERLEVDGLAPLKAREYAAACAGLLEGIVAEPPRVRYRPHPALEAAASSAARRALGDAWAWGRRQSVGSLAALTAATVTVWGYDHAPARTDFRIW